MNGNATFAGNLSVKKVSPPGPGLGWHLKNRTRHTYITGLIYNWLAKQFSAFTGIPTLTSELSLRLFKANGDVVDYGVVSRRVVTDAGVAFMVDDFDPTTASATFDITTLKYHGMGTGTTAEAVGDTALVTESTTALNPDNTRATGTSSQPAANQYRTTGTLTFDATAAITEHGIFSQAATGGGTLWDRSVFSAVNVVSGDSIQAQYTLTVNSGG